MNDKILTDEVVYIQIGWSGNTDSSNLLSRLNKILVTTTVTDKLWLASANEVYGTSEEAAYVDGETVFQKNGGPLRTYVILYREDGREVAGWLRSPYRKNYSDIAIIRASGGGLDNRTCTSEDIAIAPFFNIGK